MRTPRSVVTVADPPGRSREVQRVLYLMLGVSLVMIVIKLAGAWASGSLAVLGGAVDSGVDMLTTVVALVITRMAGAGPDERHPYGHGKFETLGALAIVAFLSITVFELVRGAIARLRVVQPAEVDTTIGLAVMGAALVIGASAAAYEARAARRLGSPLLEADAAHLRADVLVTLAVLLGLGLTLAGWETADSWVTLVVAVLIALTGWRIIRAAIPVLVDERAIEAAEIRRLALTLEGVEGVYDVRSRGRRGEVFAELTIAVRGRLDVETAHEIADAVERELLARLGARGVVVHVEPAGARTAGEPRG